MELSKYFSFGHVKGNEPVNDSYRFMSEQELIAEIKNERRWFRKSLAILTLHTLKQAQKENIRGVKWKVSDTAKLLGISIGYVSESIHLAKHSDRFHGQIEKITRDLALKILKEDEDKLRKAN